MAKLFKTAECGKEEARNTYFKAGASVDDNDDDPETFSVQYTLRSLPIRR